MTISILTLFPEMFIGPFDHSIVKKAKEKKIIRINLVNIRQFALDRHQTVDDRPYGGGVGMILKVDIVNRALEKTIKNKTRKRGKSRADSSTTEKVVLFDPTGTPFNQKKTREYAKLDHLILICGHYEGIDARIKNFTDESLSIGDYILTGGEIPAMVVVDSVCRLLPGVLKKDEAKKDESFSLPFLEAPQYTRPPIYKGYKVPQILLSGNHRKIQQWQEKESLRRTLKLRPDLIKKKKDFS